MVVGGGEAGWTDQSSLQMDHVWTATFEQGRPESTSLSESSLEVRTAAAREGVAIGTWAACSESDDCLFRCGFGTLYLFGFGLAFLAMQLQNIASFLIILGLGTTYSNALGAKKKA